MLDLTDGMHRCPGPGHTHHDRSPSLHVSHASDDGRILLHCHAGCGVEEILRAWGATWADLWPAKATPPRGTRAPRPTRPAFIAPEAQEAFTDGLARLDRAAARRAEWAPEGRASDLIRAMHRRATTARSWARRLGDTDGALALLARAADLERRAWAIAAAMDAP